MDDTTIRSAAESANRSLTEYILSKIKIIKQQTGIHSTLFAACPNSESVIKAALRAAKRANAPIKFAATLNQVDVDGGYTGMTQQEFVRKIREETSAICFEGPIIIALDHGGPWLNNIQTIEKWDFQRSMNWIKRSFEESVKAGYDLLHIDPTVDITLKKDELISIETVAERTIELIVHVENFRRQRNFPEIAYEVGTEEVHGGLADLNTFSTFLQLLNDGLSKNNLSDVWPCFVVGKVGTDLHTTLFDPEIARQLTAAASVYGSVIKGHYSDNVSNPEDYPLAGMGAANVDPEFTEAEYDGLTTLIERENNLLNSGYVAISSKFEQTLINAVINSGRWKKWLLPDEIGKKFDQLSPDRQLWLTNTGCRYIWAQDSVFAARQKLYQNLERNGIKPEDVVLLSIEQVMDKYFNKFNLINLNDKL